MKEKLTRALMERLALARDDRGDVPGWVLITLMTAGLVAVIWAIAEPTFTGLFNDAIDGVTGG
ncbi:hypothetical protein [Demequina sp. NBRC 110057]|uniref:hypothetical protein n=1 Tax=Demequina sp. NBRC 110057 TaxID=1570346 RepID=UPI000A07638A|nr:hypothetical protein [Demequina sp. NBRC 110057]